MSFSDEELERYSRQILVRNFGGMAQARLKNAHIGVIGAGGVGAPLLLYLVGAGVGEISLFEDDDIALSNLHRQILYRQADVGHAKADRALKALKALNPHLKLHLCGRFEDGKNPNINILVDGSDRLDVRQKANQCAGAWRIPLIGASLAQWEGQIMHFDPAHIPGCYECLYPEGTDASALPSCSEAGVIGPLAGVIGTMAALEVIKKIANIKPLPAGQVIMYDGISSETRLIRIPARKGCKVCGRTE